MPVTQPPDLRGRPCASPEPAGFDRFWSDTLVEARALSKEPTFDRITTGLRLVDTYDVTFAGFGGDPIKAWLHVPADACDVPIVIRYQGYGGGRGLAHEVDPCVLAGYAVMTMDTRGQGSDWAVGDTSDPHGTGPSFPGFVTRGIEDPASYYYRRLYTDAVLAVDAALMAPRVDRSRVAVRGGSQGGALAIAAAALHPAVGALMSDVPFLQDVQHALLDAETGVYLELRAYLAADPGREASVWRTLAHVDGAVLAPRVRIPALLSVAIRDTVCPPATVFTTFNALAGPKWINVYPHSDHVGPWLSVQAARQLEWLAKHWGRTA